MDPLEDVLALLGATSHVSAGLVAGGRWAVRFDPPAGAKFNAIRRGRCFLLVDGQPEPVGLAEGDCYLLTRPVAYTLFSDPDAPVQPAYPIFAAAGDGVAHAGDGDDMFLIGGAFSWATGVAVSCWTAFRRSSTYPPTPPRRPPSGGRSTRSTASCGSLNSDRGSSPNTWRSSC